VEEVSKEKEHIHNDYISKKELKEWLSVKVLAVAFIVGGFCLATVGFTYEWGSNIIIVDIGAWIALLFGAIIFILGIGILGQCRRWNDLWSD
jgi:predicted ribosome-associated RNA-binding protein Tma20